MSNRRNNLRQTIRHNHQARLMRNKLRELGTDPDISEALAQRAGIAELRRDLDQLVDGYPGPGKINAYHCPDCQLPTVVVHVDQGVTPMFLACRATADCHGRAVSTGYRLDPAKLPAPSHEWYRPTGIELRKLDFPMQDHIRAGGLMLREVTV